MKTRSIILSIFWVISNHQICIFSSITKTDTLIECNKDTIFDCYENGRFKDPTDFTCKNYYYCYQLTNGTFTQKIYSCSMGYFNPDTQSCDLNHICSCSSESASDATVNTTLADTITAVTESLAECDASTDAVFECSMNGRFKDPTDFTCRNYYYCYKLKNGTFTQKIYSCSLGYFNQDTQSCDLNHTCSCSTETASDATVNTTPVGTTTAATESLAECDAVTDAVLECSNNGRFKDPTDFTCKNYYYCYKLKNGTFTQKIFSCSLGYFNQYTQSCDLNHTCSCSTDTRSVNTVNTTLADTTTAVTESLADCDASTDAIFDCTNNGRYKDPTDFTCKKYYYCYQLKNGTFTKKIYSCSLGYFNQDTRSCDLNHTCSCSTETASDAAVNTTLTGTTTAATESAAECDASTDATFECSTNGRFKDPTDFTCKNYYYCYQLKNGTFTKKIYSCSLGYFNQDTQSCDLNQTCSCSTETARDATVNITRADTTTAVTKFSEECDASIDATFECSTNGRFKDPTDFSCRNYYYCYKLKNGTFTQKIYSCSLGYFNQDTQSCNLNHTCSCSTGASSDATLNTIPAEATTAVTESSADCDASTNLIFECTNNGRYKDTTDFTCKNYYYCYKLKNGTFTKKIYTCSLGYFNQETQSCDLNHTCSCSTGASSDATVNTIPAETTTAVTESSADCDASPDVIFKCTNNGRYKDPTEFTCKNYYYCYQVKNGTFTIKIYTCSLGYFNQDTQSCDLNHTCSCSTQIASVDTVNTTLADQTTAVTETSVDCNSSTDVIFQCSSNGKFKDPTDLTCRNYYHCYQLKNGTFAKHLNSCSLGYFNPGFSSCDINYICSCSVETTLAVSGITDITDVPVDSTNDEVEVTNITEPSSERTTVIFSTTTVANGAGGGGCKEPSINQTFLCSENGRFSDLRDLTCTSYYLCHKPHGREEFIQQRYTCCPGYFDPRIRGCVDEYVCPC